MFGDWLFVVFNGLFFLVLDPFTLRGRNFFIFNSFFLRLLVCQMHGEFKFRLDKRNKWSTPLGSELP